MNTYILGLRNVYINLYIHRLAVMWVGYNVDQANFRSGLNHFYEALADIFRIF